MSLLQERGIRGRDRWCLSELWSQLATLPCTCQVLEERLLYRELWGHIGSVSCCWVDPGGLPGGSDLWAEQELDRMVFHFPSWSHIA